MTKKIDINDSVIAHRPVLLKNRPPTDNDLWDTITEYCIGDIWCDLNNNTPYILMSIRDGSAVWKELNLFKNPLEEELSP